MKNSIVSHRFFSPKVAFRQVHDDAKLHLEKIFGQVEELAVSDDGNVLGPTVEPKNNKCFTAGNKKVEFLGLNPKVTRDTIRASLQSGFYIRIRGKHNLRVLHMLHRLPEVRLSRYVFDEVRQGLPDMFHP